MASSRRMKSRLGKGTRKRTSKRIKLSKRMRKGTKRFSKKSKNMRGGGLFGTYLYELLQERLKCGTQSKGRMWGMNPIKTCNINDLDNKINNELIKTGAKLSENDLTEIIESEFKDNTGNVVRPVFKDNAKQLKENKKENKEKCKGFDTSIYTSQIKDSKLDKNKNYCYKQFVLN